MNSCRAVVLPLLLALAATRAGAQGGAAAGPLRTAPPTEAHQFDFLLGDWTIVAHPHVPMLVAAIHGAPKLPGTWKAWRAIDGFGVEDEMRITDDGGDPRVFVHAVRVYDRASRRWSCSSLDVYHTRFLAATATWQNGEMTVVSSGNDDDGRAYLAHTRYFEIKLNGFHWKQQRSYDGGKTWEDPNLEIEATRAMRAAR